MCVHWGDPRDPCPTCECGCEGEVGVYSTSNKTAGYKRGMHKRFINGHQNRSAGEANKAKWEAVKAEMTDEDIILLRLQKMLMAGTYSPDEMFKLVASDKEYNVAVVMAHARNALRGNGASTNILYNRGVGTPKTSKKSSDAKINLEAFGNPLDAEDELYGE